MPESDAQIQAEGGKTVSIAIEEVASTASETSTDVGNDPNTFVIYNGKYKLTITIAE
jgi:hypothetical protein